MEETIIDFYISVHKALCVGDSWRPRSSIRYDAIIRPFPKITFRILYETNIYNGDNMDHQYFYYGMFMQTYNLYDYINKQ